MIEKKLVIALYVLVGFLIAAWPIGWLLGARGIARFRMDSRPTLSPFIRISLVALGGAAAFGWIFGPVYALPASLFLAYLSYMARDKPLETGNLLGAALGLALTATLPWWRHLPGTPTIVYISWTEALFFLVVLISVHQAFIRFRPAEELRPLPPVAPQILIAVFLAVFVFLSFATGIYLNAIALDTVWHHWGAYIGPSELLLSGARVFLDFPVQYGLGPTLLIAATCGNDCWTGMYFVVGGTLLAFAVLLGLISLRIAAQYSRSFSVTGIVLLSVLFCAFFWNSYPPLISTPATTPSTNGLRFLPVLAFAAVLLFRYAGTVRAPYWQAHLAWVVCALWSPESAFMASLLWWPFYLWLRCSESPTTARARTLFHSVLTLVLMTLATVATFLAGYWLLYRTLPTLHGFLAYLINPPGVLPISPSGSLWFFAGGLAAGCYALYQASRATGDGTVFRERFILILLAYGTLSYFLGRSHDNNILNILAFIMPLLLSMLRTPVVTGLGTAAAVMFSGLIGWSGIFGWDAWRATLAADRLLEANPRMLLSGLSYANVDTARSMRTRYLESKIPLGDFADATRAIASISSTYREPITVLNITLNMIRADRNAVWSAIHNPANFSYMPSEYRREFIVNTAGTLGRPGWMLIDRGFPNVELVNDMNSAYAVTKIIEFGTYYAVRYAPKADSTPN